MGSPSQGFTSISDAKKGFTSQKSKGGGGGIGGFLHGVEHYGGKLGTGLYKAAVDSPAGAYALAHATGTDVAYGIRDIPRNFAAGLGLAKPPKAHHELTDILAPMAKSIPTSFAHP